MHKNGHSAGLDLIGGARGVCLFLLLTWLCVSMLIPCDSGQIAMAGALPYSPGAVPQNLGWLLLALAVALLRLVDPKLTRRLGEPALKVFSPRLRWIKIAFGVLAVAIVVSTAWAAGASNARENLNVAAQWLTLFAVGWSVFHLVNDTQKATSVISLLVGMTVAVAIHGLYQSAYEKPRDIAAYDADPEAFIRQVEFEQQMNLPPGSSLRMSFEARLKDNEATGPFSLANSLAGLLASVGLVTLVAATTSLNWIRTNSSAKTALSKQLQKQVTRASRWNIVAIVVTLTVLGIGLYLANSRTAVIALASGLVVWVWQASRSSAIASRFVRYSSFGTIGLLSVLTLSVWVLRPTEFQTALKSVWFRLEYWRSTIAMFFDHILLGVGPANFRDYYLRYKLPLASESPIDPHNFLLETISTIGVLGGLALVVGLASCIRLLFRTAGESDSNTSDDHFQYVNHQGYKSQAIWISSVLILATTAVWFIEGLIGEPPLFTPYLVGLPVAGIVAVGLSLRDWSSGEIRLASLLAIVVLLVHLSFSGGWLAPGLMYFAVGMLAIGLRSVSITSFAATNQMPSPATSAEETNGKEQFTARVSACGCCLAGLVLFYIFVWQPVGGSQRLELLNRASRVNLEKLSLAMVRVDPFSTNLQRNAVVSKFQQLQASRLTTSRFAELAKEFDVLRDDWLKSDSADWLAWNQAAQFELARREGDVELAADYLQTAQQLNPTRISLMLETALVLEIASRSGAAKELVKQAIDLDREIPHEDRKIWCQVIEFRAPMEKIPKDSPAIEWIREATDSKLSRGMFRAKPLAEKMSSHYDI